MTWLTLSKWPQLTMNHCCGNIVSLMFRRLCALETFVAETFFAFEQQKLFLNVFSNTVLLQQNVSCRRKKVETLLRKHFTQCFRNNFSSFAGVLRGYLPLCVHGRKVRYSKKLPLRDSQGEKNTRE